MKISGIYKIECRHSSRYYLGRSIDVDKRFTAHKRNLEKHNHHNSNLQELWDTYGPESLVLSVIEECPPDELQSLEQQYINEHYGDPLCINESPYAGGGYLHCSEISARISKALKGRKKSEATKRKISLAKKGQKHTEEQKKKISDSMKRAYAEGRAVSHGFPEGMNCANYGHLGKKHTPEAIAKIKAARARQPDPRLGKKHTPETIEKIRAARMNRYKS